MAKYTTDATIHAKDFLKDKIAFHCSSNGTCGKCKIKITGNVSAITESETKFLSKEEIQNGIRLACFTEILGAVEIETFEDVQKIMSYNKHIAPKNSLCNYICAIDIGTTTVVCVIYNGKTGALISEIFEENAQRIYGADVISRITKCTEIGTKKLQDVIRTQLNHMYKKSLALAHIDCVDKTVITANTTMLHILEGLNPECLGHAPFQTTSLFGTNSDFLSAYIPKCVSAYVGADLLCATLHSKMTKTDEISILIDIGTNGEMCIYKDNRLACCSVAAGPALEGCGLSCGSPAIDGAITRAYIDHNTVTLEYIGDSIKSICGSGIISLVSALKDLELIDETGRFSDIAHPNLGTMMDDKFYIRNSQTYISQKDIRQIQLAKSAICAGLYTLIKETNTDMNDIAKLYIAGGLGSNIDISSACNIGLIPSAFLNKTVILGNAALAGAIELALGYDELSDIYDEINLSSSPTFMDYYLDCMMF